MEGGVITLKFEADTSEIKKSFEDLEKAASRISKINIKTIEASTKNLKAQAEKINAETAKTLANFKKAHPEIEKAVLAIQKINAQTEKTNAEAKKAAETERTRRKEIEETEKTKRQYSEDARKTNADNIKLEDVQRQEQKDRYAAELTAMQMINDEKQAQYLRDNKDLVVNEQLVRLLAQKAAQTAAEAKGLSAMARSQKIEYDEAHQEEAMLKARTASVRAVKELNAEQKVQVEETKKITQFSKERQAADNKITAQIKENTALINQQTAETKKQSAEITNATQKERTKTAEINKETAGIKLQTAEIIKQSREQRKGNFALSDMSHYIYQISNAIRLMREGFEDIGNAIRSCVSLQINFTKAIITALNPAGVLVSKFVSSSGIFDRIKSFFSASGLINFGKEAVEASSDLVEVQNIVETAFPNMVSEMNEWADNSIQAFGLSEKSAKQYAATLGLMAQSAGLAEKASYKLGTGLTSITADLASIYNMKAENVYEKIRSGVIGGRTAAIAQLGINMNQANLQAYMASKGMTESYGKLDNATKTAIRYNYVIEQTKKIQGDFLKTQKSFANQQRILLEQITQLKQKIGDFLATVITPLIIRLNQLLQVLIAGVDKLRSILTIMGIEIQKSSASGSSGVGDLTDSLYENAEAAEAANAAASKLSDGPFSEMHKLSGDTDEGALTNVFGDTGLLDIKEANQELKKTETWFDRIKKIIITSGLTKEVFRFFNEIKLWIQAIKDAWNKAWNSKGAEYLQSVVNLAEQILGFVNDISQAFRNMWESGWGEKLFTRALEVATHLNNTVKDIIKNIRNAWNAGSGQFGYVKKNKETKSYEGATGNKKNDKGVLAFGNDKFDFIDQANDMEYRELTWGEYFAEQFFKAQEAMLDFMDSFLDFIGEINAHTDWTSILEGWSKFLGNFGNKLNDLSTWFEEHDDIAAKIGELITAILSHPEGIMKTVIAINLFKGAIAGLPKIITAAFLLKMSGLGTLLSTGFQTIFFKLPAQLAGSVKTFVSTLFSDLGAAITGAFEMDGLLGGLIDVAVLFAGIAELIGVIVSFFKDGLPMIFNQIKQDVVGFIDVFSTMIIDLINGDILKAITDGMGGIYHWLGDWVGLLLKDLPAKLTGPVSRMVADFCLGLIDNIKGVINTVKDLINLLDKSKSKANSVPSYFNGSKGISFVKTSGAKDPAFKNIKWNANGGAYKPNDPQIIGIGDHPRQMEYALTEGHLDNIAERMTGAIVNGFMRVSNINSGNSGGNNTFVIQMGDEQFKDFIVKVVAENAYRT